MIIVSGTIEVESEEELERVKSALIRRAAKSRTDEGNLDYVFSVSIENPLQIRLYEEWVNEDLLNAHLMVPDDEFNGVIANARLSSARVVLHEASDARELMTR